MTCTLHEDQYTFLIISRSVLLRMRNVSDKSCRENQNTNFKLIFFLNRTVYERVCENIVERCRTQMTIWRVRVACWIPKATDTHSEYVILITFPLQQWLQERATMLRYAYIACLVDC
jgi:hypothetical protein